MQNEVKYPIYLVTVVFVAIILFHIWQFILPFGIACAVVFGLISAIGYQGPALIPAPTKEPWYLRHPRFITNACDRESMRADYVARGLPVPARLDESRWNG